MNLTARFFFLLVFCLSFGTLAAQNDVDSAEEHTEEHADDHGGKYDPVETIMHHIADGNEFEVFHGFAIPLPVILFAPGHGWTVGMSSMFDHGHHAVDGYVMNHGRINRIADESFPQGHVEIKDPHAIHTYKFKADGGPIVGEETDEISTEELNEADFLLYDGKQYKLDRASAADAGLFGGGITSFYDFSITKNVFGMMLAALLLIITFTVVARGYKDREGQAPSGFQGFMEPVFLFIRDEVAIPMIGKEHYARFLPFIMSIFFFILFCNLLGLIPIFPGSANITGNLAVTMGLAILVFIITNINGKKDYWQHVFWMPGVPIFVKPILAVVEILGLFIKPFSLMIRLFANITAGHIIILSLIGLVFVFGNSGESIGGATVGAIVGGAFTAFMNLIELLVAFLQAFIFAMLGASYIGAAVEEHDHHDEDHAVEHNHGGAYAESVAHH
ncbi:F0F1 ATP synthase subunit A [Lewinella sp. 4G2]|uniref:F0F1 ATP synthase subunit A n=1 Tax=Lewinella sp. 4G2 TaxID=1803372 RepID=UPI0007B462B6|nr:F0F1 ATP synthase subunit A [Lewinella sp. 4G2]OAV46110.1 ATP synthase F0 subunit A [Lewinella sp. 4G2]